MDKNKLRNRRDASPKAVQVYAYIWKEKQSSVGLLKCIPHQDCTLADPDVPGVLVVAYAACVVVG